MMTDVYESLRSLLDIHPFGCPPAPEIIEILKILFTEDEAQVALGLAFRPFSVEEVAARAGVDPHEARKRLESLADKGLVFARQKEGVWGYALFDILRIFENPLRTLHWLRALRHGMSEPGHPFGKGCHGAESPGGYYGNGHADVAGARKVRGFPGSYDP